MAPILVVLTRLDNSNIILSPLQLSGVLRALNDNNMVTSEIQSGSHYRRQ